MITNSSRFFFTAQKPLIAVFFLVIVLFLLSGIQISQTISPHTRNILGNILGEEDENKEVKESEEQEKQEEKEKKEEQEIEKEEEKEKELKEKKEDIEKQEKPEKPKVEITKTKTEITTTDGVKLKSETEGLKQETEMETKDGQKIKTKIEDDGTLKVEVENKSLKIKYQVVNGEVVKVVENEKGERVELKDEDLGKLDDVAEDTLNDDDVKLVPTTENQLAVTQNEVAAVTKFPLSVDVSTNSLVVTTPAGQKIVTVLPEQAIKNLLATGILNKVETSSADAEALGVSSSVVNLEMRNKDAVYKIRGTKNHKLFGIIPVTTPVTAFVSVENGNTNTQQSVLATVVDILSQ